MHLLAATPGGFVDDTVITDLQQQPADIVILSAADTTLTLLAAALPLQPNYPSVRIANLLYLRQPASVDLYIDNTLRYAKLIIVDHLGGESYWPYGTEQVIQLARNSGIALVMFSGDLAEDINLLQKSTLPIEHCRTLWRYLREGGTENARAFYHYIGSQVFKLPFNAMPPKPLPPIAVFHPDNDIGSVADWQQQWHADVAAVAVVFYRSHLQAGNTRVFSALCDALLARGLNPLPVALTSLKDDLCLQTLRRLCRDNNVQLILNTTAFSVAAIDAPERAAQSLVDDIPVLQVILSSANTDNWQADQQGLQPRDIAMQIALPEVDGRIITRAISFKGLAFRCERTQTDIVQYQPHAERIGFVVELALRWCRLRELQNPHKRIAVILANYPNREGRIGNGVGLDTPASTVTILNHLQQLGYDIDTIPADGDELIAQLTKGVTNDSDRWTLRPALQSLSMPDYRAFFEKLPAENRQAINERWGEPEQDPMLRQNRFMIAGLRLGKIFVGIQPPRGYQLDPQASYHDPDLVPPHHYLAFYLWLRDHWQSDAVIHVGKHGNLEWLPGKSVALSEQCWPDLIFGPLPHLYPFIVNDPGEGSQAKRRSQAVIIDHLMPPLTRAENYGPLADLERQVDEFYEALSVDPKRAKVLRTQILANIVDQNLHRDLGLPAPKSEADEQALLNSTDTYLCELKESQIRDGLHIFGHSPRERQLRDTLLALARYPVGNGRDADSGILTALADDLALGVDFDPLNADWQQTWTGPRPHLLQSVSDEPWRNYGDTRERLELLAQRLLEISIESSAAFVQQELTHTAKVMARLQQRVLPDLLACGEQELLQLGRGLEGKFVPPGPSGAPSRGRLDVLPTGRNFYSVDTRAIPTPTSWMLGFKSAEAMIERYLQEHGDYPRSIGLSVWGTATMRTGGDDIAQAMALIGVKPKWAAGSHRVTDFEILPMSLLDRPRIDVTLRISGFFRDAFSNVIQLFDAAVQAIANLDEPASVNPIRQRILEETAHLQTQGLDETVARAQAGYRIFGAKPGAYGAGLQNLIDAGNWSDDADIAQAYLNHGGYAYGQTHHGIDALQQFGTRLAAIDIVMQNQDNREHDLLDSDDYYQFHGGMTAAVRHISGQQPTVYFGDHSNPQSPHIRTLQEEISRVIRSRVVNPKWIAGITRHGYKGAFEIAATVDYLYAYDVTARVVRDDQYAQVTDAFIGDATTRDFLQQHNADALKDICERLLEAIQRGLWQQPGDYEQLLQQQLLVAENYLENSA